MVMQSAAKHLARSTQFMLLERITITVKMLRFALHDHARMTVYCLA